MPEVDEVYVFKVNIKTTTHLLELLPSTRFLPTLQLVEKPIVPSVCIGKTITVLFSVVFFI